MHPIARKIAAAARNPRLIAARLGGLWVSATWPREKIRRLLATWNLAAARSRFETLVFDDVFSRWIRNVYLKETDPDAREALKYICMTGLGGVHWAESYDSHLLDRSQRYGELGFDEAFPQFAAMDAILSRASAGTTIVQIGCSSGREMAYFAQRFPRLSFIGTDIDEPIVERAGRAHPHANLQFKVARAHEICRAAPGGAGRQDIRPGATDAAGLFILGAGAPGGEPLILFASGSLQYVQPEHLEIMFNTIGRRGRTTLVLGEPWQEKGASIGRGHSRWRGNFSYSHDYRTYAERAGLKIIECRIVQPFSDPRNSHFHARHYFFVCTTGQN